MDEDFVLDEWARRLYLAWIAREIRCALVCLQEIRARAGNPPDPAIWILIEAFLTFTAKVSKMLNPPLRGARPKHPGPQQQTYDHRKSRGDQLRALLQVREDAPVLDRTVRDASEHFDERLDDWIERQPRPTADDRESGTAPGFPSPPLRRVPDHDSWEIEVAGNTIQLGPVEAELQRILDRITRLEPLTAAADSYTATLLASLPSFPAELGLNAPTRRPDEHVLTGVDPAAITAIDVGIHEAIDRLAETFNAPDRTDEDPV